MLLENNLRGGVSSCTGDRYVKTDENKDIFCVDAINLYGWTMSECLPYDEIEMWHGHPDLYMKKIEEISNNTDDSVIGHFVEVDLRYPENVKEKTEKIPFWPGNKILPRDKNIDFMKKI